MMIEPRAGFDWAHVAWGKPNSPRSTLCSYCSAGIPSDSVPLILCKPDGHVAQFCRACTRKWWGFDA